LFLTSRIIGTEYISYQHISAKNAEGELNWFVRPISHGPGALCNFSATVTGIDLNDLYEEDLMKLKEATHKYKVIVIKN
jgi:hypothetical protein